MALAMAQNLMTSEIVIRAEKLLDAAFLDHVEESIRTLARDIAYSPEIQEKIQALFITEVVKAALEQAGYGKSE